ncbi:MULTISPECIES: type B 50S ribosomal protein L31 [Streptomyces]|uniref:type B 50S ribosomal protein L31 n=1 Tax=Streptomyces TaxID=1883 RepID=UPI0004CA34C8|nr:MULTISPECIES: type B 50S ribosomal protein L31 [Streptomyces]RPK79927.1 50S ribosomal protein L31 type B [Streptomyces sp. ADI98-10]
MQSRIHPVSRPVVFRDRAADVAFLTRSTVDSGERVEWQDGNTYPVIDVKTSSASHPFCTGGGQVLDTVGRVERFRRRYGTGEASGS